MKILQINKFHYQKGGSERYYFELADLLEENGHQVVNFSMQSKKNNPSEYAQYFSEEINIEKFNLKNVIKIFYNNDAAAKLEKLITKEKPDIAHLHNISYHLSPSIIKILKKHKIPIVITLHDYKIICPNYLLFNNKKGYCEECRGGRFKNCYLNKCVKNSRAKSLLATMESYWSKEFYKQIDFYIAPSVFMKEMMVKGGFPEKKIIIIPHFIPKDFVDYELKFNNPPLLKTSLTEYRQEGMGDSFSNSPLLKGGKGDFNYFLYFGRISKEKGIDVLIEAFKKLDNNYKLKIVGEGEMSSACPRTSPQDAARDLGLESRIELLGYKKGNELIELIKNSKAVIVPSLCAENLPYTIIESFWCTKPVIASRIGSLAHLIKDGKTGYLFNPNDGDNLKQVLEKFINSDTKKLTDNITKEKEQYSPAIHYERIKEVYDIVANIK